MAIHTGAVGSTDAVRRYVNAVPHQVVAWKKRTINGTRHVKVIDPMHGPSDSYTGHWVRWTSLKKCALAIKGANGGVYAFRFPIGGWTRAAAKDARIANLVERKAVLRDQLTESVAITIEQKARIVTLVNEVEALTEQLTEAIEDGSVASREHLLDELVLWMQGQRA